MRERSYTEEWTVCATTVDIETTFMLLEGINQLKEQVHIIIFLQCF